MSITNAYHRKDGRWEGRIPQGKSDSGRRKFKYIFARTKEEVLRRMEQIRQISRPTTACCKTLRDIYFEWFSSAKHRIKGSTAANYTMKAHKHILPAFGEKPVSSITQDDVYAFIADKRKSGFSERYIADIVVLLKSIFKYAAAAYHIFTPLDGLRLPKRKRADIRLLDKEEQERLQRYISANHDPGTLGTALAVSTGIRIGELCALQWKDIDLEKRILTVSKTMQRIQSPSDTARTKLIITDPKSESSRRKIPIPDCMIAFLRRFKSSPEDYVLSGTSRPIEPRTMQYRFSRILKNANLPSVHFHALRHIFASTCIRLGFDVKSLSEILGHSSVEITLNRYVHSSFEQKRAYMKQLAFSF